MSATWRATAGVLAAWVLAAAAHASEPRVVAGPGPALALEVVGPAGPSETFAVGPVLPAALRETALEETVRVADMAAEPRLELLGPDVERGPRPKRARGSLPTMTMQGFDRKIRIAGHGTSH